MSTRNKCVVSLMAIAIMSLCPTGVRAANYTWNGGDSGVWQTGGSGGWLNVATPVAWTNANIAIFTGTTPKNITINGTVAPSGFTVNSGAGDYTFSGGTLNIAGNLYYNNSADKLTFATAVTQTAATYFRNGAYALDASGSLGGAYNFTFGYGAGTSTMSQSGNVTITTLILGNGGNATATWTASGGILTASGDVRIAYPNIAGQTIVSMLDVIGATVNTPTIYIPYASAGTATATLKLRSGIIAANSIYKFYSTATSAFEVSGGTLKPYNNTATYGSATAANNNDITLTGPDGTISSVDKDGIARTVNIYSAIGDGGNKYGLTFAGSGTSTNVLRAANTYSGATVVSGGTLRLNTAGALSQATGLSVASGAKLNIPTGVTNTVRTLTVASVLKPAGTYDKNNLGSVITGDGALIALGPKGTMVRFF
jgi:autotransporter-associated beta strand protein